MNQSGINQGTSGNISARVKNGILITPSSIPYNVMSERDLLKIDFDGNLLPSQLRRKHNRIPSSEWRLHTDILSSRHEVNAVVHCHSINATAIACLEKNIPSIHYMVGMAGGENIRCAPYATFGTSELSASVVEALKDRYACLLGHHGQITIGSNLDKAFELAIEVETLASIFIKACQIEHPKCLGKEEIKKVIKKFNEIDYGKN